LPSGHALIIAPSNMVHTFFMRFPIDILIAARDGRVVKAAANVPARRMLGSWRGFAVVEMRAGALADSETRIGDIISLGDRALLQGSDSLKVSS
jgi:uncharacterized membrane protein (UPF0127 family)